MSKGSDSDALPFTDNPGAPDVFATNAVGFVNLGGAIGITFETIKVDHTRQPPSVRREAIARVVMPVAGARALAAGLGNFLKESETTTAEAAAAPVKERTARLQ